MSVAVPKTAGRLFTPPSTTCDSFSRLQMGSMPFSVKVTCATISFKPRFTPSHPSAFLHFAVPVIELSGGRGHLYTSSLRSCLSLNGRNSSVWTKATLMTDKQDKRTVIPPSDTDLSHSFIRGMKTGCQICF